MLDIELAWFGLKFQGAVLTKRGTAFQDFFSDIMEAAHGGDFERVRPYGKMGDLKCDGLLRSTGIIFQVYAPRDTKQNALVAKIVEDFAGAKLHWGPFMKGWWFVHNDPDGLPPKATRTLAQLAIDNPNIETQTWGCNQLQNDLLPRLPRPALIQLFDRPPSRQDFDRLTFEPVGRVLKAVSGQPPHDAELIAPVSSKKLEANALTPAIAGYLRLGRQREPLVQQYLDRHPNPTFGESIATAFRDEYRRLKGEGYAPNEIFASLQAFAGGSVRGDAEHEAAVLAVMSYLFERCDIFEPAPEPNS